MRLFIALLSGLLLAPLSAQAENATKTNGYTIHHNAITTDSLPAGVASQYGIQRSKGRALINVAILKDKPGTFGEPVNADVVLKARNLIGQVRDIPVREVREEKAIYYIADFPVADRERLNFALEIKPNGEYYALQADFEHEFFTR